MLHGMKEWKEDYVCVCMYVYMCICVCVCVCFSIQVSPTLLYSDLTAQLLLGKAVSKVPIGFISRRKFVLFSRMLFDLLTAVFASLTGCTLPVPKSKLFGILNSFSPVCKSAGTKLIGPSSNYCGMSSVSSLSE
jgi:hypothetical protein